MSPRCRSWRPMEPSSFKMRDYMQHSQHTPQDCRVCWHPCNRQVEEGTQRCTSCWELLLTHAADIVKEALLDEPNVPTWVLRRMAEDESVSVALTATRLLEARGADLIPEEALIRVPDLDQWGNNDSAPADDGWG